MQKITIGRRIRQLRKISGRTQQALAEELYVSQKTISSWECDRTEPGIRMMIRLTEVLHTDLHYLMTGQNRSEYYKL